MIVTQYCNYLNHHQVLVADELYRRLGENYHFVATVPRDNQQLKGGMDYSQRPYCLLAAEDGRAHQIALELARISDVCLFGSNYYEYVVERSKGPKQFCFEISERWLKKGWINLLSPAILKNLWIYWKYLHKMKAYKLCQSAFAASDHYKLHTYVNRCFKWAYFTRVDEDFNVEASPDVSTSNITPLMWCSRYLMWKHPELPVLLAKKLKDAGYSFRIDMYGEESIGDKSGYPRKKLETLMDDLDVNDCVRLMGHRPNSEILEAMRKNEIFLFTSDRNEGWGAVANEAMSNGCVLVGSDEIGSVPYLVKDGVNGLIFRSQSIDSLYEKIKFLLDHPVECKNMSRRGYSDMVNTWNAKTAVSNLLDLIDDLMNKREVRITEGPCSKA